MSIIAKVRNFALNKKGGRGKSSCFCLYQTNHPHEERELRNSYFWPPKMFVRTTKFWNYDRALLDERGRISFTCKLYKSHPWKTGTTNFECDSIFRPKTLRRTCNQLVFPSIPYKSLPWKTEIMKLTCMRRNFGMGVGQNLVF